MNDAGLRMLARLGLGGQGMLAWRQTFLSADNFSRSPTSQTIGDTLLRLSAPEADTEYPFVDKLAVEDRAQPAEIRSLDLTRKEKTISSVFSRRRKGKPGPDNKMHNTNNKGTEDVAVARPVENTKEYATSLAVAVNKKGSQVHKSLSTDNRDKPPSSSAIPGLQKRGHKKKASKKDKHSTDSAIVPTKGKGDEGSNDGDNPTSSSQVVLYASHVEECAVDTAPEETSKGRPKRTWKKKIDRVYKTISEEREEEIMVQKRKSICFAIAGRSFHGENDRPKNIPAGTASEHQGTLLIKDSNAVQSDTVDSIKNLMQEILNLTSNLQTTSQLLNRGIPEDNEDRKINNLKLQTSSLLSMFELFGEEHKSLLNRYCIDAQSSEMNQVTSIPAANDEHRSCVAKEAHQTVELDVGKATGEQQAIIVEENCKKKSNVMPKKKKKKKHKVSNKTDSIGDQQLEEVHPDPEHPTGSLPEILNPRNPQIQESNKELAIQMSGKKDAEIFNVIAEADMPELGTSAARITKISAHKLAESLDPKDAETSNVIAEADAPDLETSAATISETSADMLAESLDPNLRCNRIQRNNDGNVNTRKLGNLVKAINPVDDSLLLDRYEMIKIPCFEQGDKDNHVGHYFVMAVNLRRKRFELLDSLGGEGAKQHFLNMAEVFKEIWKEAYKQSEGRLSPKNLDDFTYEKPKVIPLQGATVPDMKVPITGAEIKRQFANGEFMDGGTMDYIIDEMKTTSELYDTGERVLLSQGFIMTEAMQYSRRSTGSRTQEPAPANLLVYHRRSARERELADERNIAYREQEVVGGLEQLGECLVRTAIMELSSPNAPPHIRRACRPSMPSMAELPRRVDGLHPREARNQHICAGEYPPLEHLERALEGQYLHALIPPEMEKQVTASIVLCKV
ncbi:hypothetical protein ACQ4PT_063585 [Festuca glaucescens]